MHNSKLILVLPTNRVGLVLEALNGEFSELSVIPCDNDNNTNERTHKTRQNTSLSEREIALLKIVDENPGIGLAAIEPKFSSMNFHGPTASPLLSKLVKTNKIRYEGMRPRRYFISN